jgi:hypothetical protein
MISISDVIATTLDMMIFPHDCQLGDFDSRWGAVIYVFLTQKCATHRYSYTSPTLSFQIWNSSLHHIVSPLIFTNSSFISVLILCFWHLRMLCLFEIHVILEQVSPPLSLAANHSHYAEVLRRAHKRCPLRFKQINALTQNSYRIH